MTTVWSATKRRTLHAPQSSGFVHNMCAKKLGSVLFVAGFLLHLVVLVLQVPLLLVLLLLQQAANRLASNRLPANLVGRNPSSVFLFGSFGAPVSRRHPSGPRCMDYEAKPGFNGMSVARSPEDENKLVWSKLQDLRNSYLEDMIELYGMLTARSNQPMPAEQLQKLKHYKDVLHRMIPYLRVPKERVPKEFNVEKVDAFEKQIVNIMETFKRRREGAA